MGHLALGNLSLLYVQHDNEFLVLSSFLYVLHGVDGFATYINPGKCLYYILTLPFKLLTNYLFIMGIDNDKLNVAVWPSS
jgi:hypothetical protein